MFSLAQQIIITIFGLTVLRSLIVNLTLRCRFHCQVQMFLEYDFMAGKSLLLNSIVSAGYLILPGFLECSNFSGISC